MGPLIPKCWAGALALLGHSAVPVVQICMLFMKERHLVSECFAMLLCGIASLPCSMLFSNTMQHCRCQLDIVRASYHIMVV